MWAQQKVPPGSQRLNTCRPPGVSVLEAALQQTAPEKHRKGKACSGNNEHHVVFLGELWRLPALANLWRWLRWGSQEGQSLIKSGSADRTRLSSEPTHTPPHTHKEKYHGFKIPPTEPHLLFRWFICTCIIYFWAPRDPASTDCLTFLYF